MNIGQHSRLSYPTDIDGMFDHVTVEVFRIMSAEVFPEGDSITNYVTWRDSRC